MNPNNDQLDLNLLRVFFAIWDLRNLTSAGARLGLTQPAISHALRRLREHFNDPLFVRSTNRMLPTETAVRLHGPLDEAFAIINRAVQERASFDPPVTQRRFRIAMSDIAEIYGLPRLLGKLTKVAPMARIDVVPLDPDVGVGAMRSGEIDLSVGHLKDPDKECLSVNLFDDRFVCMIRAGHPLAKTSLKRNNFEGLRFFFARISTPTHQLVEQWLNEGNSRPQIAVRGHFTAAPDVVRNSDLAAIFPETLALRLPRAKDFRLFDLPFPLPPIEVKVHSHARFASDLGIAWMSATVAKALKKSR